MRLPPVLSSADLPAPELHAARLDGQLFAVDGCFAPVDEIEQPAHRAQALLAGRSDRLIAEQFSAAWVWGAVGRPPRHHQFCVAVGARVSHCPAPWLTLREVVIDDTDVVRFGSALVTSPTRTIVDLARFADDFEPTIARALLRAGASLADARREVAARRNLPNKRTALERLSRC